MSYAIIGFGKIGHALAKAFARNDIEVSVATTRDPESFASDAAAIGPTMIPTTLAEAVKADIIFLPSVSRRTRMSRRRCPPGRERPSSKCRNLVIGGTLDNKRTDARSRPRMRPL